MKFFTKHIAIPLVSLMAFGVWISLVPYAGATAQKSPKFQIKPQQRSKPALKRGGSGYKVKKGSEVAAKVRTLSGSNREVRAALKFAEDKKRTPKIDNSFAVTGKLSPTTAELLPDGLGPTLEKASFVQTSAITATDVELIFVPVLSDDMEWQGTVISTLYDSSGAAVGRYIAESILIMPNPNLYAWDEIYEAPVNNGIVLGAIAGPGMYTNVDFGLPLSQQQISKEMNGPNPSGSIVPVRAGYPQSGQAPIAAWANCAFGWCGGAGLNCVGTDFWTADALNSSCFASGCGNYAVGCVWGTIWQ
jgi:hypothetical protein